MLFTSDNWGRVHPSILEAITAVNEGFAPAYGNDDATRAARQAFEDVFEHRCSVFFVPTGSAANGLALSSIVPPYGAVLCHEHGHVLIDECGAPEFYTGGAKVIPARGEGGKLTPATIGEAMAPYHPPMTHRVKPTALSLTQATEWGTAYSSAEIGALCETARGFGLRVHMDGARFAGSVNASGESPADLTWRAGVELLSLGATKNGCLAAEAVVAFTDEFDEALAYRAKRAGLGTSKQRFFSAQWPAYFRDGLWLELAGTAHRHALSVAQLFEARPDTDVLIPADINEVFVTMEDALAEHLRASGAQFYDWVQPQDRYRGRARRFVTSWETTQQQVTALGEALNSYQP
jgi:threonine aldolase